MGISQPFNGWSKAKEQLDQLSGVTNWTLHDLRRTFSTNMARLGVPPHVTEAILNHKTGTITPIARIYNRYNFMPEMKAAMDKHDAFIAALMSHDIAPM